MPSTAVGRLYAGATPTSGATERPRAAVTIEEGEETVVVYDPPRSPLSPGQLHPPGEAPKVEISRTMVVFLGSCVLIVIVYTVVALIR